MRERGKASRSMSTGGRARAKLHPSSAPSSPLPQQKANMDTSTARHGPECHRRLPATARPQTAIRARCKSLPLLLLLLHSLAPSHRQAHIAREPRLLQTSMTE